MAHMAIYIPRSRYMSCDICKDSDKTSKQSLDCRLFLDLIKGQSPEIIICIHYITIKSSLH